MLPFEKGRIKTAQRRGVQRDADLANSLEGGSQEIEKLLQPTQLQIRSGHSLLTPNAESAYRAFLAYYVANPGGLKPTQILECANEFAYGMGLAELPPIESKVAARLGLQGQVTEC